MATTALLALNQETGKLIAICQDCDDDADNCEAAIFDFPTLVHPKDALKWPLNVVRNEESAWSYSVALSPEKADQFEGDPDVSHGVFVSQAIPEFMEYLQKCATALELNGGPVFDDLRRFDPNTGALSRQPVGSYTLAPAADCGR